MSIEVKQTSRALEQGKLNKKESSNGIREILNKSRYPMMGLAVGVIIVACIYIVSALRDGSAPGYASYTFYSDDDGATYFKDSNKLVAPFDHNGKPAYHAHVYTCDGGKTNWVAYLDGYLPDARKKVIEINAMMEEISKSPNPTPPPKDKDPMYIMPAITRTGLVVKKPDKPGQPPNKWVTPADAGAFAKAQEIVSPEGQTGAPIMVLP